MTEDLREKLDNQIKINEKNEKELSNKEQELSEKDKLIEELLKKLNQNK